MGDPNPFTGTLPCDLTDCATGFHHFSVIRLRRLCSSLLNRQLFKVVCHPSYCYFAMISSRYYHFGGLQNLLRVVSVHGTLHKFHQRRVVHQFFCSLITVVTEIRVFGIIYIAHSCPLLYIRTELLHRRYSTCERSSRPCQICKTIKLLSSSTR